MSVFHHNKSVFNAVFPPWLLSDTPHLDAGHPLVFLYAKHIFCTKSQLWIWRREASNQVIFSQALALGIRWSLHADGGIIRSVLYHLSLKKVSACLVRVEWFITCISMLPEGCVIAIYRLRLKRFLLVVYLSL